MKRGEVWTAAGGPDHAGKPRPVVIVQHDAFSETASVTICGFTTQVIKAPISRPHVAPSATNGLTESSWLMTDKIMTVPRIKLGRRIGYLDDADLLRLNRAIMIFLGLTGAAGCWHIEKPAYLGKMRSFPDR